MSYCDWAHDTGIHRHARVGDLPPGPGVVRSRPYGYGAGNPWTSITEQVIYTKGSTSTCTTWNGHSAPGNFYS